MNDLINFRAKDLLAMAKDTKERIETLKKIAVMELARRHREELDDIMNDIECEPERFAFDLEIR